MEHIKEEKAKKKKQKGTEVPNTNVKSLWKVKVKRIQYHQTSLKTNVKGTYIVRKYKRRKRSKTNKQTKNPNN